MPALTPAYDNKIYQKYSKKNLQNKEKNKIAFCQDFDLNYDKASALLCLTFPLSEKTNIGILKEVINGILEQNVILTLIGVGTQEYQNFFTALCENHPGKIAILSDSEGNKRKIYAASNIFLATSSTEECLKEMECAMQYGVIPVSLPQEKLVDYDLIKEEGNAFVYSKKSHWSLFAGIIRALESFKFPYDWKNIQIQAMELNEENTQTDRPEEDDG